MTNKEIAKQNTTDVYYREEAPNVQEKKIRQAAIECADEYYSLDYGKDREETNREIFTRGAHWALQEYKKSLWHDATKELPEKGENCIVRVSCEYEDYPEDNYEEYNTAVYLGGSSWSEDHFDSEADVYVLKWCRISDLLPKEGGKQ